MKKTVLFFAIAILAMIALPACGGGDTDDGENNDIYTDVNGPEIADNAAGDDAAAEADEAAETEAEAHTFFCPDGCPCCDEGEFQYDPDYPEETTGCVCVSYPETTEFMWIQATWKCVSMDNMGCDYPFVKVTVDGWNNEKQAAEVNGFEPCNKHGFVKMAEDKFIFFGYIDKQPDGRWLKCENGVFDLISNTLEFDSVWNNGETHHWKYML